MFHRVKLAVVAGIAMTAFTMSAMSAETPRVRAYSVKVNYSDLDLTKADDAREMLGRLERAASTVCGGNERFYPTYKSLTGRPARFFEECREDALSRAVATVDARELWAAFGSELRLARSE
jgi:UrcA family protein